MPEDRKMISIDKKYSNALDMLAEAYRKERSLLTTPTYKDTVAFALMECLERRGITFLPAPEGCEPVPVWTVTK